MFERLKRNAKKKGNPFNYILRNTEIIDAENDNHYISLISKTSKVDELERLSNLILSMNDK